MILIQILQTSFILFRVMYTKRADRHTYNIPDTIASHLIQPCPNGQVYNVLPDYRPNHIAPQRYIRHFYRFHVIPEVEYVRYKSGCFLIMAFPPDTLSA